MSISMACLTQLVWGFFSWLVVVYMLLFSIVCDSFIKAAAHILKARLENNSDWCQCLSSLINKELMFTGIHKSSSKAHKSSCLTAASHHQWGSSGLRQFYTPKWTCCIVWTRFPSQLGWTCSNKKLLPYLGINLQLRFWFPRNHEIMFSTVCLLECDKAVIRLAFSCVSDSGLTLGSLCSRHTLSSALILSSLSYTASRLFPDMAAKWALCLPY